MGREFTRRKCQEWKGGLIGGWGSWAVGGNRKRKG